MTDRDAPDRHEFSSGSGFGDPYEGFDLDPPEIEVDTTEVDPVDSHVLADLLDERTIPGDRVDADALIDVGLNYLEINRDEQAVDAFERAARFAEDDATRQEARVNKGIAHAELEEWAAAIDEQEEALFIDEDGEFAALAHTNLAYAYWEFGEDEKAVRHAEDAVRTDERLPQAWYNLGFIQVERGQFEDALECLDNAIRLGFRQADVYQEKARALEGLERDEEAAQVRETAEAIQEEEEQRLLRE